MRVIVHNCRTPLNTEQFSSSSLLTSRRISWLRCCLLKSYVEMMCRLWRSKQSSAWRWPFHSSHSLTGWLKYVTTTSLRSLWHFIGCQFVNEWPWPSRWRCSCGSVSVTWPSWPVCADCSYSQSSSVTFCGLWDSHGALDQDIDWPTQLCWLWS